MVDLASEGSRRARSCRFSCSALRSHGRLSPAPSPCSPALALGVTRAQPAHRFTPATLLHVALDPSTPGRRTGRRLDVRRLGGCLLEHGQLPGHDKSRQRCHANRVLNDTLNVPLARCGRGRAAARGQRTCVETTCRPATDVGRSPREGAPETFRHRGSRSSAYRNERGSSAPRWPQPRGTATRATPQLPTQPPARGPQGIWSTGR